MNYAGEDVTWCSSGDVGSVTERILIPLVCHWYPSSQFEYWYAWSATKHSSRNLFWKTSHLNRSPSSFCSLTCLQSSPPVTGYAVPRIEWWISPLVWINHVQQYHWCSKEVAWNRGTEFGEFSSPAYSSEAIQQRLARYSHCRRWRWYWCWCRIDNPARLIENEHTRLESPE